MRDRLDGISVFVDVVEAGGFARAADRLALTRSAVGKSIARLEERLGVRLFHRTTRSQSLTEEGQLYFEKCLRALEEVRSAEAMIESGRREVAGRLRVTMPVLFGRYCVEPILLGLAREHPKLELDLRYSDAVADLVGEGYDLAVRNRSPGEGTGLQTRRIAVQRKVFCAAPGYLAARGTPSTPQDLAGHDILMHAWNGQHLPWMYRGRDGSYREAEVTWRLQFDNVEAVVDAVLRDFGVAWVPSWLVRSHIETGQIVQILLDYPSQPLDTYAVWPMLQHMPMRLRVAIDALAADLQRLA
jgi:DNA-binding transcriptional LysR family regulator